MKKIMLAMIAGIVLVGCDSTQPIVEEFNGDSVKIVTSGFDSIEYQRETAQKEADRICGKVGKKAEYASTYANSQTYQNHNLYLCL